MLLKPVLPVFEYIINYNYIVTVVCINKDKVELQCNGKCHLKKELAKSSEQENSTKSKESKTNKILEVLFLNNIYIIHFENYNYSYASTINYYYSNLYTYLKGATVFHPPLLTA